MEEPSPLVENTSHESNRMTCLGINNEGYLRYDYYHEDLGQNDAVGQTHVYNGYDSVLWNNFSEAFADEIQKTYSSWRSGDAPLLSYDNVIKYFITNQSDKWSISIYNEDAEYKYISLYRNNNDPSFLYQVKGTGEEHLKYFIKNRLMYCDSKWQTGDFINKDTNTILLRLNSPDGIADDAIKPDMTIKYKTFSNMYTGVRYGTNGILNSKYTDRGNTVSFPMPAGEDPNNLDTYIFGANEISELEDLSLLYCNLIKISAASKLTRLIVGNNHPNYKNDVLKELYFTNNRMLREVNICNCTGLTKTLDFSLCPDIQYIYAIGSKIAGVQLPASGFLKVLHLPNTISDLTLINQHHIQEFLCEGYGSLATIKIENTENMPIQEIILNTNPNILAAVSIKNVNWNADSEQSLQTVIDKLIECKGSTIDGAVYLPSGVTISDALKVKIHQNFPNLNVIDDKPVFYIDYYNYDNTIWDTETVQANYNAVGPSKGNPDDIIQEEQGLRHLFVSWKELPKKVNKNHQVDATWQTQYAIKFYNGDEYLYPLWYNKDEAAEDPVASGVKPAPTKEGTTDMSYQFSGWDNLPTNVQSSVSVYAQFDIYWAARFWNVCPYNINKSTLYLTEWIIDGGTVVEPKNYFENYTNPTYASTVEWDYTFSKWDGDFDTAMTSARDFTTVYTQSKRKYVIQFLDYAGKVIPGYEYEVAYGSAPFKIPSSTTRPGEYVFKGWYPDTSVGIVGKTTYSPLFKFTGYLFGKLGQTEDTATDYGWVDEPNWDKINAYWDVISADITAYKNNELSESSFFDKYPIGGRMLVRSNLDKVDNANLFIDQNPVIDVEIIGHNHDSLADGSGKSPLTFFCLEIPNIIYWMNSENTNAGGWRDCDARRFLNEDLFNSLPSNLKSIIAPVSKISDLGGGVYELVTTSDNCWLASSDEVNAAGQQGTIVGQGSPYASVFTIDSSRKKYLINTAKFERWRLRTTYYPGGDAFVRVTNLAGTLYSDGGASTGKSSSGHMYLAFGFCI